MKDYDALSKKHSDGQAAEYDQGRAAAYAPDVFHAVSGGTRLDAIERPPGGHSRLLALFWMAYVEMLLVSLNDLFFPDDLLL